jgi:DNA modification methylase
MAKLPADSVHAIVTDPPYHLAPQRGGKTGFMGRAWDGGDVAFRVETWEAALRVLKPGGYLLAFGGTRTSHRMVCAIEDAGFEIRDSVLWLHGQGFSKGFNLRRAELCDCGGGSGNAIPCPHEEAAQTSKHDLRSLRDSDLPPSVDPQCQRREILFPCVSEQGLSEPWAKGAAAGNGRRQESSVEGRFLYRANQGLSNDQNAGSSESSDQWIRSGTHLSGREGAGKGLDARGRGTPQESCSDGQSSGKSYGLQEPCGSLDAGALSGCGACTRCGKLRKEFAGFSSSLKPAAEPIVLARKPLAARTVAANVLEHGTGALNIDACRVPTEAGGRPAREVAAMREGVVYSGRSLSGSVDGSLQSSKAVGMTDTGRWPANVIHDGSDEVEAAFAAFGERKSCMSPSKAASAGRILGGTRTQGNLPMDAGTASRFFYCAKATKADRAESRHPTVKPLALMRWLCQLVTPPGGTILDPFAGSGTTLQAAVELGFSAIGIELEAEHVADIHRRLDRLTHNQESQLALLA